ncbi:MAG: UDP-N-acetylmuramate dehydrogenase [Clostridia bacterium]|nr:UDP-N-acetylmuramate dehydrogenase [Clostridia bacterium]
MSIQDDVAKSIGAVKTDASAKELTTFKGGGTLKNVFLPKTTREFLRTISALYELNVQPFIIGGGSNLIVADGEIETPAVLTKNLNKARVENGFAFLECGVKISDFARLAREQNLGGLEFLAGVPLTLGGAIRMNASAFSRQIFDFVESVFVFSTRACYERVCEVKKRDVDYGYRKGADGVIVGAKLKLERVEKSQSLARVKEYLSIRAERQPRGNTCGSVFKNGEIPSGKLIEKCGLKGLRHGGAEISRKHANFIVNTGGATAADFLALVEICERRVYEEFGIKLEREFKVIR